MNKKGFGLIEVLVASAILALVVGGAITLMRTSLRRTVLAADRTVAMNLAQEAVEAVRSGRDTTYTDQIVNSWVANMGGDSPGSTSYKLDLSQLNGQGSVYSLVSGSEVITLNQVDFKREIFVDIPSGFTANAGIKLNGSTVSDRQVIRRIRVLVSWGDLNNPSPLEQVEAITYLTDWRGGI